jgi:hypothetical protein
MRPGGEFVSNLDADEGRSISNNRSLQNMNGGENMTGIGHVFGPYLERIRDSAKGRRKSKWGKGVYHVTIGLVERIWPTLDSEVL